MIFSTITSSFEACHLGLTAAPVLKISYEFNKLHPHNPIERRLWKAALGTPKNRIAAAN
jgi:hypothetical protein